METEFTYVATDGDLVASGPTLIDAVLNLLIEYEKSTSIDRLMEMLEEPSPGIDSMLPGTEGRAGEEQERLNQRTSPA